MPNVIEDAQVPLSLSMRATVHSIDCLALLQRVGVASSFNQDLPAE
jgi:hypothetical protein